MVVRLQYSLTNFNSMTKKNSIEKPGNTRRSFIGSLALGAVGAGLFGAGRSIATGASPFVARGSSNSFKYCLNTSTIRGQKLGLPGEVELAAKAGYNAIEPWVNGIQEYKNGGGSLKDLNKRISDLGLTVESAIAFSQWIVDDDQARAKGMEDAKRDMDLVKQIGGFRIAAPPSGATNGDELNLLDVAKRYRALLELGDAMGVVPELEVWGFSKNLHLLGQSVFAMIESGHPKACLLPDVYHVYRGGSDFAGLGLLGASAVHVIHMNDYPRKPVREKLSDSDRVYPGDGVAPWAWLIPQLRAINPKMVLSLELFSQELWKLPAEEVATTGLRKMKAIVEKYS